MQIRILVLFVALLGAAAVVARADRYERPPARETFATFPMQIGKWRGGQQTPFTPRALEVLGLNDYVNRAYYAPNQPAVGLYVGYWESQRQGDTIHSPQNCLPGAGWAPVTQGIYEFPNPTAPGGPALKLNRYVVQKGVERILVLYWYQSHGRITASEYWSKYYLVADAVRLNRTDGAIVRVIAPIVGETAGAEQRAEAEAVDFVKVLLPQLNAFLPL